MLVIYYPILLHDTALSHSQKVYIQDNKSSELC